MLNCKNYSCLQYFDAVGLGLKAHACLLACFIELLNYCLLGFDIGRGVFLREPRPKGSFLVEYYGEVITANEGTRREEEAEDNSVFRYFITFQNKKMW